MNSFTKLKDGTWGVKFNGDTPVAGMKIEVTKRDGTVSNETVDKVLWSSADHTVHLVTIVQKRSASSRAGRGDGYVCAECGRGGHLVSDLEDGLMKHYRCCDIPPGGY